MSQQRASGSFTEKQLRSGLLILVSLFSTTILGFAQNGTRTLDDEPLNCDYMACNCFFAEIGANGIGLSLNYEKMFSRNFGVRLGYGSLLLTGSSVPLLFSWYIGSERKLELGLGVTYLPIWDAGNSAFGNSKSLLLSSAIAGKFQPHAGGLMIRFAATPFYSLSTQRFILFGGISLGIAF